MAEALVAVGVAANVVQLLDVGARLIGSVRDIYTSNRDGVGELPEMILITSDFKRILNEFDCTARDSKVLPEAEQGFQTLVSTSQKLATDLLNALPSFSGAYTPRRRDALKEALKRFCKDEIPALQLRLERLRQELMLHLLALIR